LSAGDFAVLVRTHAEASLIRKELRALAITSVSFSQESVFASKEARQLLTVLTALHDLSDTALVRTALVTELFGYTAERLEHLRNNEQAWEELMRLLIAYRQLWQQQGILPMLQKLLKEQQTVSRLQMPSQPGNTNGERALTNFLHLAELLQEEARYYLGTHGANALLRWFSDQIHSPEKNAEKQQLRLESDEHLVKIVTIHKAKGMEYPIVFLPFLWAARPCSDKRPFSFHQQGQLFLDLGSENSQHFALAEKERLAEDLRLLYVAVTRARTCCFFCWGRVSKMDQSALCYLLHNGLPEPDQVLAALHNINRTQQQDNRNSSRELITVKPFPERFSLTKLQDSASTDQLSSLLFQGKIDTRWQLTSYSRLISSLALDSFQTTAPEPERPDYDEKADKQPVPAGSRSSPSPPVTLDAFCFPKGAAAGTCLHAILEKISLSDATGHETVISTELARAGFEQSWSPVVAHWIQDILATNLETSRGTTPPYALAAVQEHDRVNEMAFYFPLESLHLNRFNQLLEQFSYPRLPSQQRVLEGLMVGFIDLVFSMHGRYYLADYKSNYLGNQPTAYQQPQLQAAMLEHRYDVQFLIYTLALHRFLRGRIKTYQYDEHFGGVFYLFLRGMHPTYAPGTGVFAARPPFALINALDQAVGNYRKAVHA
ncbi:MAG: exodeoxyribonuclease V subunit beta, partial [Candidatus Electrothrix sp. LOE1_4_5]|nr:exodeoxyribonuclease V subunit beta [Candidatus Electrothrix gigas]